MKKYLALLFLLLSTPLFAQINPEVTSIKNLYILEGAIDDKYPITMHLTIEEDLENDTKKASGKYYYNNSGDFLYFDERVLDDNSIITLKEFPTTYDAYYSGENSTGEFIGTLSDDLVFKGTWGNVKNSFTFEVKPNPNAIVQEIEITEYAFTENSYSTTNSGTFDFSANILQIVNSKNLSGIEKINEELNDFGDSSLYSEWEGKSNPGGSKGGIRYLSNECEFIYSDDTILFVFYTKMRQAGGPYPNTESLPLVYSLDSGEILTVRDLVYSVDDEKLLAVMRQKIMGHMRQKSGGEDKDKSDEYLRQIFYDFNSIRLENYTIEPSGITFIYSQGEIAAHVFGLMEIHFTFEELKPFVKRNSELWYLFE